MNLTIVLVLLNVAMSTCTTFLYCYIGSITTENFLRYADISYESMWYKFPLDFRQYLRLMIGEAQRPRVFQGLGTIELNLDKFAKVRISILFREYLMVMRYSSYYR